MIINSFTMLLTLKNTTLVFDTSVNSEHISENERMPLPIMILPLYKMLKIRF